MEKKRAIIVSLCIVLLICGGAIGWVIKDSNVITIEKTIIQKVESCSTQAKIAGLWLPNLTKLSEYDGKYICININSVKTLAELNRVCNHEIGHEVYARECETNITKCLEMEK